MKLVSSYPNDHVGAGFGLYPRRFRRHYSILICNFEDGLNPGRPYEENCLFIQQYCYIDYSWMIIDPPQRHFGKHMRKYLSL